MPTIDSSSAHALLRECHSRRLDREGIPMVLAMVDERGPTAARSDAQARDEGERFADLLGQYAGLLVPEPVFRHDDEGAVITALQVLAHRHFEPGADS
jgi:hypothetical protein